MIIKDFIKNNYDIIYKNESVNDDFSNVNEFLLGEDHGSPLHAEINSLFIKLFSNEDDVVLIESVSSMQQIEKDEAAQAVWLSTPSKIMGWDLGNTAEILNNPLLAETSASDIKSQILQRQILDSSFDGNKAELKLELAKEYIKQSKFTSKILTQIVSIKEAAATTFPVRTQSMITSLIKAKQISRYTFLIAGETHLQQEKMENPLFSLKDFYNFLSSRNAVILFPKQAIALNAAEERKRVIEEALSTAMKMMMGLQL